MQYLAKVIRKALETSLKQELTVVRSKNDFAQF